MLKKGLLGKEQTIVSHSNSAIGMGSGCLEVFSTPAMIALMEKTACESVEKYLEDGKTTVGIAINVKHTAATALGMMVLCESELLEVDGRRLVFKVTAFDKAGVIGTATHERMIVDSRKFMEKTIAKRDAKV